jgi:hypothetical protein
VRHLSSIARALYRPTAERARARSLSTPAAPPARGRRGVALIMVLVITTVMSALAADLGNESQVNVRAAANARDELQAYFHARSAIELELFLLRFQGMIRGTLSNFIPIPLFELSGMLVSSDTMKGVLDRDPERGPSDAPRPDSAGLGQPFGDFHGSFWIEEVVDENRKININSDGFGVGCQNFLHLLLAAVFDDPRYDPIFEGMFDSRDPVRNRLAVIANISDWTDANDSVDPVCMITGDTSVSGPSEDTRYDRLPYNARYRPKNGMFNSLAELRMVPGVNDAFMRVFARYFTVWSDSVGISMTTADDWMVRAVIRAVSPGPVAPGDEERIKRFFEERALLMMMPPPLNKLSLPVFQQLLDKAGIRYDSQRLTQLEQKKLIRFDDVSSVYRITAVGRVNDASSRVTVVWRDNRALGELYYWHEE